MGKELTREKFETMRYFIISSPDIIKNLLREYSITVEFMNEFSTNVTPELFTKSYHLSQKIINAFPQYYSDEIMNEYLTGKEQEEEFAKNLEDELAEIKEHGQELIKKYGLEECSEEDYEQVKAEVEEAAKQQFKENLLKELKSNWSRLSISIFLSKKEELKESLGDFSEEIDFEDILYHLIQECDQSEVAESAFDLIGINEKIDKLVLELVTDAEARNAIILRKMLESGADALSPTTLRYCSNEMKDSLLHDGTISIGEFLNIITSSAQYISWCKEKFDEVESGVIQLQKTNLNYSKELLTAAYGLPEDIAVKLFKLYSAAPGTFSPILLEKLLKIKDFSEDQLIDSLDCIKKMGGYFEIKKYAKLNKFDKLLGLLK